MWGTPPKKNCVFDVGRGGGCPLSSSKYPTRRAISADKALRYKFGKNLQLPFALKRDANTSAFGPPVVLVCVSFCSHLVLSMCPPRLAFARFWGPGHARLAPGTCIKADVLQVWPSGAFASAVYQRKLDVKLRLKRPSVAEVCSKDVAKFPGPDKAQNNAWSVASVAQGSWPAQHVMSSRVTRRTLKKRQTRMCRAPGSGQSWATELDVLEWQRAVSQQNFEFFAESKALAVFVSLLRTFG